MFQEQTGVYGPIVIAPKSGYARAFDRDYVVMLSDWSDENPDTIVSDLKFQSDYYNYRQRTLGTFFDHAQRKGLADTVADRIEWGRMRMSRTDILDVSGAAYTYLINGQPPGRNWTALFRLGERVRLRFISPMSASRFTPLAAAVAAFTTAAAAQMPAAPEGPTFAIEPDAVPPVMDRPILVSWNGRQTEAAVNIGEAANASGMSAKTIRYYEAARLITPANRTKAGYRVYAQADVVMLRFIKRARDLGFSIERIRRLVNLWQDKSRASADVKRLALDHIAEIRAKIAAMTSMVNTVQELADAWDGDERPECPSVRDLEDAAVGQGG